MSFRVYAFAALSFAAALSLNAAVLTVTSLADSGPGSLRAQVAASAPGDTIQFSVKGTILLNSAITIPQALYVQGPGASALIVDGQNLDRVFVTTGDPVFLSGMTITNGFAAGLDGPNATSPPQNGGPGTDALGGGILDYSTNLYVSNCWITSCTAQGGKGGFGGSNPAGAAFTPGNGGDGGQAFGGAMYATGSVFIVNCTFSGNLALGGGGGTGGTNGNPAVNESGGTGGAGGASQGGAVNEVNSGTRSFMNATFSGNRVTGGAGGAGGDSLDGPGGNGGNGGGCGGGAIATVIADFNCNTIITNSAAGGLGGLGGNGGPPGVNGSTGGGTGGGIVGYSIVCLSKIGNSIVAENAASGSSSNFFIKFNDEGYNYFGTDDNPPLCVIGTGTQQGTVISPIHPLLRPLAQNGSGLPTHAVQLSSPVLDAGSSVTLGAVVTTDERGAPRPYDFSSVPNAPGGDGSDIGAFELGQSDLGAKQIGTNVIVSWPAWYGDFALQSTTNLAGSNYWSDVTIPPVVVSNQFVVTNEMSGAYMFYRLINPPPTR